VVASMAAAVVATGSKARPVKAVSVAALLPSWHWQQLIAALNL
jgi:hypothetical protein